MPIESGASLPIDAAHSSGIRLLQGSHSCGHVERTQAGLRAARIQTWIAIYKLSLRSAIDNDIAIIALRVAWLLIADEAVNRTTLKRPLLGAIGPSDYLPEPTRLGIRRCR